MDEPGGLRRIFGRHTPIGRTQQVCYRCRGHLLLLVLQNLSTAPDDSAAPCRPECERRIGKISPGFKTISKLLDKGKTWIKLSGAYQDSKVGPPSYSDTVSLARAYIKAAPEQMVWGSDWPHPTEKQKPDDAVLFDLLTEWAPDDAVRTAIW
jgi:hypothetical protein